MRAPTLFLAILAVVSFSAAARAEEDIPAYQTLTCDRNCPSVIPARVIDAPLPAYPMRFEGYGGRVSDALVDVDFTIGTDGTVKNAVVEYLLGPQEFAERTLNAVNARRYQPATEGGQAVEESHRIRFTFRTGDGELGGRMGIVAAYQKALILVKQGKTADAIAALREIAGRPELNFYERTMATYELATLYYQTGDYMDGRDMIRIATIGRGRFLDGASVDDAIRLRIRLEALCGEFAEAFAWISVLRGRGVESDTERSVADKMRGLIAGPDPLAAEARIPADANPAFWQHTLLRRGFEFHEIVGKLDSFELRCQHHGIRSAVSDKSSWTIPASWSGCFINVTGTPGTKFTFVENAPAAGGTLRPAAP